MMGNIEAIEVPIPEEHDAWGGGERELRLDSTPSRVLSIFGP
jgi:hypothetical protein